MWINVRSMDGKQSARVDDLSKLSRIEDLKLKLQDIFDTPCERQRLFFRGKQLENEHTLFDYDVRLNDTVQIFIKQQEEVVESKVKEEEPVNGKENVALNDNKPEIAPKEASSEIPVSSYFKVGDKVDAKDKEHGAWFEAKIVDIKYERAPASPSKSRSKLISLPDDGFVYFVTYESYPEEDPVGLPINYIRPRAKTSLKMENVKQGDFVMVNYNAEEPGKTGFWFDCKVTGLKSKRNGHHLVGTLYIGTDGATLEDCCIDVSNGIFAIEEVVAVSTRSEAADAGDSLRKTRPNCSHCRDIPSRKCRHCSCHVCGGKDEPAKQILCDECDFAYHLWCLEPPLSAIPEQDDWYCSFCKNDENEVVKPGEKLKSSKKKAKMASATSRSSRDWGKGMACVGRTKECTLVPPNHFGPVPGVEVGMLWKFRVQVSETGGHRPHVAGIHGRESDGAFSIVLSGGYEDDVDEGEQFKYTGSGGRDLSGNKRTAEQSCDQTLTRMNKALALNCAAKIHASEGAEAKNWKDGKPVRVFRSVKGAKHSDFCPEEGIRYDGIYKIVKYWPEKGKSGFVVWRYLLRRDDPTPAPWTKLGKKRIKQLGFTVQYPEGYLETEAGASEEKKTKGKKRPTSETESPSEEAAQKQKKKKKKLSQTLSTEDEELIKADKQNVKIWKECQTSMEDGRLKFLNEVENQFSCICCQDIVAFPVTTPCLHNICKSCLQRSFKAEVYTCPTCRYDLGKNYAMKVNEALSDILNKLFPGYSVGR